MDERGILSWQGFGDASRGSPRPSRPTDSSPTSVLSIPAVACLAASLGYALGVKTCT